MTDGWVVRTNGWRFIQDLKNGEEHLYWIGFDRDEDSDVIDVADPEDLVVFDELIEEWQERNWR
jgi:hypothetical protein